MTSLTEALHAHLQAGAPAVLVTVARALGSTPREAGARMLVGVGDATGTIGGGRLEFEAILAARQLIAGGGAVQDMEVPLGPAIGQCCGGHVAVRLELADRATLERLARLEREERDALPVVYLFGAGHVGKTVAHALAPLPLRLVWIDSRADEFPDPAPAGVERIVTADPAARLETAPAGASALILTHSHALDFALAETAVRRDDFTYTGLIGSATKRRRFERWYVARGGAPGDLQRLVCPIGAGLSSDKRPAVIAAMVAAELLIAIDKAASGVVSLDERRKQA